MKQAVSFGTILRTLLVAGAVQGQEILGSCQGLNGQQTCNTTEELQTGESKQWILSEHTSTNFEVAGVDLSQYKLEKPFELFEDFNIGHLITGNEGWDEIRAYRNKLERPSLSFYVDKVARKRWLPKVGFNIPRVYALHYAQEVAPSGTSEGQQIKEIHNILPRKANYCAKPTHMSLLGGNMLVQYDSKSNTYHFSNTGRQLETAQTFHELTVASNLVESLHTPPEDIESWALKNVEPGFVVEELWTAHDNIRAPPHEFNMFTIWGRLWVGQWNYVEDDNRWCAGFFHRDRTFAPGSSHHHLPEWVDWNALVDIAERLGANKDMLRVDIFVGVPMSSVNAEATLEERTAALQIAVSESEIFPTTIFRDDKLPEEATRLWIAGYKTGNYRVVPNTEVPKEFVLTKRLSSGQSNSES